MDPDVLAWTGLICPICEENPQHWWCWHLLNLSLSPGVVPEGAGDSGGEGRQSGLLQHHWADPEFLMGRKNEEKFSISREWSPPRDGPTASHRDPSLCSRGAAEPHPGCLRHRG